MKNGRWICGLVLCMGGWTTSLFAQEAPQAAPAPPNVAAPPAGTTAAAPAPSSTAAATSSIPNPGASVPYDGTLFPNGVQRSNYFVTTEYLLWWTKQDKVPVLSSTSSDPFDNGELGRPTTQVLFGGGGIDGGAASGVRLSGGFWLDDTCKDVGFFVSGFYLAPETTEFSANSGQYPTLARPFFNINQGVEFAEISAFPGRFTGSQTIQTHSNLFGTEANAMCNWCCGCNYRLDFFGGFRFVDLEESMYFIEDFHGLPTAPAPFTSTNILSHDFFGTQNQFYGGQVGLSAEYNIGAFSIEARGQVALGDTHQSLLVDGDQLVTPVGSTTTTPFKGDLYALPSNIGHFERDRFSVVPELDINFGYLITNHLRAFIGYDILYWSNVLRPGGQIDRDIDITQIPNFPVPGVKPAGQNQPSAPRNSTDFWAQGLTFGIEIRF